MQIISGFLTVGGPAEPFSRGFAASFSTTCGQGGVLPGQFGAGIVSGVTYSFEQTAPTPEPATLMLFGAGALALWVRSKRRD